MNQQRQRRFRSAKDMKEAIEAAVANGVTLRSQWDSDPHIATLQPAGEKMPEDPPFDSNCITPGTEFMAKLSTHLRYYVRKKVPSYFAIDDLPLFAVSNRLCWCCTGA